MGSQPVHGRGSDHARLGAARYIAAILNERSALPSSPLQCARQAAQPALAVSTFFESPLHFRAWLEAHHGSASELIVAFKKVGTGAPSMKWSESVDEALCFGWIDGVRKKIDDDWYQIRFTPRKRKSIWSHVNVAKVLALTAQARMRPAGLAAFEARSPAKTGVYAFERQEAAELAPAEVRLFKKNRPAWDYFEAVAPSYRRTIIHWVVSAKRAATRERRLEQLIQASAERKRILR